MRHTRTCKRLWFIWSSYFTSQKQTPWHYISCLQDLPRCHHRLELPRGITYQNTIFSTQGNTLHGVWSLSTYAPGGALYDAIALVIYHYPRGSCFYPPRHWSYPMSRELFPFLLKEKKKHWRRCFSSFFVLEGAVFLSLRRRNFPASASLSCGFLLP